MWQSEAVNQRADNTMKKTKTMDDKAMQRKLKIEQQEPHRGWTYLLLVVLIVLLLNDDTK
jgi:hypothetical protein